jgi:hypothetical protein
MTLICLVCVSLVLGGLALRPEARAALEGIWLWAFGSRVPVRRQARPTRPAAHAAFRADFLPPPQVQTRPGPGGPGPSAVAPSGM